ncbi:hypothetical protein DFH08DRAFT_855613 [Mycena albidolilacea]|uniref:cAMP-independent regulatory protein pac2 n=1 Tax=Mycena albidolilacea TaxID=1033008 RepID=A0AAD7EX41_9AGAR|nr:hypothetical protein DFH08DRAFT_855613 [Mycena albidolilacea]
MPPPLHPPPAQQPTCTNLRIRSVEDAHKIFFAIRRGVLRMVSRRLDLDERAALKTGCVYAWEERSPNSEITGIGIERFTEGRRWSASRVRDEFLFYYEKWVPDPNQGSRNEPMGWEQLVKQTYSVWVETGQGKRKWHLTAYFTQSTVDQLGTVDDIPDVRHLQVPSNMFTSTRIGKRKNTDSDLPSQSSVARVYAAFPSPLPPIAPRPTKSTSAGARPPSPVRMYEPYSRPQSRTRMQSLATYHSPHYTHPGSSTLQSPGLHYSYPSPQNLSEIAQPPYNYTREIHERPPPPAEFSATRVRLAPQWPVHPGHPAQPQPRHSSGGWITSPIMPYQPRPGSPRSDYNSSSSSSSSYASSPTAPLYPLFSGFESGSSTQSLPRLLMPVEPTPIDLISDSDERRGEIGPCRDLAPLSSLARSHPYRRDPMDDKALRLLGPRQSLTRDPSPN